MRSRQTTGTAVKRTFLTVIALISSAAVAGGQQASPVIVLRHANLADGARGAIATNAALVIRDGQIAQIENEPFNPPAGATVIDVAGRYVVPGLIDAHTHISTLANARRMRDLLMARGYQRGRDLMWVEDQGGMHNEAAWGRRFRAALPFLLARGS